MVVQGVTLKNPYEDGRHNAGARWANKTGLAIRHNEDWTGHCHGDSDNEGSHATTTSKTGLARVKTSKIELDWRAWRVIGP